eukprot:3156158-Prymnesium_polylepis.1
MPCPANGPRGRDQARGTRADELSERRPNCRLGGLANTDGDARKSWHRPGQAGTQPAVCHSICRLPPLMELDRLLACLALEHPRQHLHRLHLRKPGPKG